MQTGQVSFGLAATRWEEEEVHRLPVGSDGSATPGRLSRMKKSSWNGRHAGSLTLARRRRRAAATARLAMRKCVECLGITCQQRDPVLNPVRSVCRSAQQLVGGLAPAASELPGDPLAFSRNPLAITVDKGTEGHGRCRRIGQRAENIHRELDARDRRRLSLLDLGARNPAGAQHEAGLAGQLPVGRDTVSGGVLGRAGVVQLSDLLLPPVAAGGAQVRAGNERLTTPELEPSLEGEGTIGFIATRGAAVDEEHGD